MTRQIKRCAVCVSRCSSVFCQLDREGMAIIERGTTANLYRAGDTIFYQGNPPAGIYCVGSGAVALRKRDDVGNSVIVRLRSEGDVLGQRAYFAGGLYDASAEALTDSSVCFIAASALEAALAHEPSLSREMLARLAADVSKADAQKLAGRALDTRSRVARLLLELRHRFGEVDDDGVLVIHLPLSRQDIAAIVDSRPETVTRCLRSLEADGIAGFRGRRVTVPDLDKLLDLVEPDESEEEQSVGA